MSLRVAFYIHNLIIRGDADITKEDKEPELSYVYNNDGEVKQMAYYFLDANSEIQDLVLPVFSWIRNHSNKTVQAVFDGAIFGDISYGETHNHVK